MEWLELFVELSEKGELNEKLAEACKAIGMLHNTLVSGLGDWLT